MINVFIGIIIGAVITYYVIYPAEFRLHRLWLVMKWKELKERFAKPESEDSKYE